MTTHLPLFPLGIVAFPFEQVNLHIFEPRYKQLISECEKTNQTFGILPFLDKKLMHFGTEMKLLNIEKVYANGEMDIKTLGMRVFKLEEFYPKLDLKLYGAGDVTMLPTELQSDYFSNVKIIELVNELFSVLEIKKAIPEIDDHFSTFKLGHLVGFNIEQEFEFLILKTESDRQVYMYKHLESLLPIVREMHKLQERAKLNGHFRNIIPPDLYNL
ncbi:MAG: LON peptidase substrate-binding domain-containing protein [Saprospiraceae bacterium]